MACHKSINYATIDKLFVSCLPLCLTTHVRNKWHETFIKSWLMNDYGSMHGKILSFSSSCNALNKLNQYISVGEKASKLCAMIKYIWSIRPLESGCQLNNKAAFSGLLWAFTVIRFVLGGRRPREESSTCSDVIHGAEACRFTARCL